MESLGRMRAIKKESSSKVRRLGPRWNALSGLVLALGLLRMHWGLFYTTSFVNGWFNHVF
jgi:hypothetical protein